MLKTAALQELIQSISTFYWIVPVTFYLLQDTAVNLILAFTTLSFTGSANVSMLRAKICAGCHIQYRVFESFEDNAALEKQLALSRKFVPI